jgi:hypothetical protein
MLNFAEQTVKGAVSGRSYVDSLTHILSLHLKTKTQYNPSTIRFALCTYGYQAVMQHTVHHA